MSNGKQENIDPATIEAHPTKEFFITMLTRDLSLKDAIGDLVDNCVDGARALSPDNYSGFEIFIDYDDTKFKIRDNCGGIDINTARNYAFRFGRPTGFTGVKGSVGQFGIGMKRSLFKIGKEFSIISNAEESSFKLDVDVEEWQKTSEWEFKLKDYTENKKNLQARGTEITIQKLNKDVKSDFNNSLFLTSLKADLELENTYPLSKGLTIKINNIPLKKRTLEFSYSEVIKPAFEEYKHGLVSVKIVAGVGEELLEDGGWYLFCNGRLVLGPEQTHITGWTGGRGTSDGGPKYHGQYMRFRGYVFFEADDASLLPWNTTKNGVDYDSAVFKQARQKMINIMKPVITFLNKMKEEREGDTSEKDMFLKKQMEGTQRVNVATILDSQANLAKYTTKIFQSPSPPLRPVPKPTDVTISYKIPKVDADRGKRHLNTTSNKALGEFSFKYFMEMEVDN
ncbi:ATP-binding protein [Dyadobacter luteus]|uniref:ATP-binding protein n=1 Tax=Dyadobacter luteus TaxID=2259619 RepID=A0A3D8YIP3_9BACT|nr:ATP-binding protein [Dyadobacter luteus]REA63570.1 ATP-binding protein [Dyadobacter luteus]